MRTHDLKCWSSNYQQTVRGDKPFEIRRNDRDYAAGDTLRLWEWLPDRGLPTGRFCAVRVGCIRQGTHGLPADVCVMGFNRDEAIISNIVDIGQAARIHGVAPSDVALLRAMEGLP